MQGESLNTSDAQSEWAKNLMQAQGVVPMEPSGKPEADVVAYQLETLLVDGLIYREGRASTTNQGVENG